jgi:flagellar M-ring protein FliF
MTPNNAAPSGDSANGQSRISTAGTASSQGLDALLTRWQALSMGVKTMVGAGAATLVLLLVLALTTAFSGNRDYKVLFSNVSGADGAAIVAALQQMNVPYQFTEGGGAIMVPQSVVYETRLNLAGQGLPKAGNVGFELLENQKFGTSQFVERVNYLRGLEGELSRSIGSIGQVKAARVHLAVPKQTAFVREQERPSASVLVTLHPGRMLDATQSAAIARLVSSSVPGMLPQDVSILDTEGGSLVASQQRSADMDARQLKYTTEMESVLAARLAAILSPLAGADGFRAQVTVDMNFDDRERTEEVFSRNSPPNQQSIRSEQTKEAGAGGEGMTGGIPGALTNQPQNPPEAPIVQDVGNPRDAQGRELAAPGPIETGVAVDGSSTRRERTINYEVDRAIERFKPSKGQVRRVSAAVVLDNKSPGGAGARSPYTPEEIQQITMLVRDAIGFVPARGDTVSVVNLPFSSVETPVDKSLVSDELLSQLLRYLAIAVAVLFVWFALIRPLVRALTKPAASPVPVEPKLMPQAGLQDEQLDKEAALQAQREAWNAEELRREQEAQNSQVRQQELEVAQKRRYDELVGYLQQYVAQEPDKTALQLRAWVGEPQSSATKTTRDMERL